MRDFRVTKQCDHFPVESRTQHSEFIGYDLTHKASLAMSWLILCVTQRGINPKSTTDGTEDLTSMLNMSWKGFFHTSSSSVP